jgi:hypothetical protein
MGRYGQHVSAQRGRSATANYRSINPNIAGVPWWAAVVIGVTAPAAGVAFDAGSGSKELTDVFSVLFAVGCVAAVLAVRQSSVFTAVVQPPLILFCVVPAAYWLFHGAKLSGLKSLAINCGYPLIERFPLMLFTSAVVLLIGMIRWCLGLRERSTKTANADAGTASDDARRGGLTSKLVSLFYRVSAAGKPDGTGNAASRRARGVGRSAGSAKPTGRRRPAKRPAASRSRRVSREDLAAERPRRRRPTPGRDLDPGEPYRQARAPRDPGLRTQPPELRRDPQVRRHRPTARTGRLDSYEPAAGYGLFTPSEQHRRSGSTGTTATHHPISRVRYRESAGTEESHTRPYDI